MSEIRTHNAYHIDMILTISQVYNEFIIILKVSTNSNLPNDLKSGDRELYGNSYLLGRLTRIHIF